MRDLNYFIPYTKNSDKHEDHLTRAYLALLRFSDTSLKSFYSLVLSKLKNQELQLLHEIEFTNIDFSTQIGSLPVAEKYLSILLTDESLEINRKISPVKRKAVYDGVIDFQGNTVFFIETKPKNKDVWEKQLCPSIKDVSDESKVIDQPVILEWKEIIDGLHLIINSDHTLNNEKLMVNDFFELINSSFDYLNPYNKFSRCHSNYLANKRIEELLKNISTSPDAVNRHRGWAHAIEVNLPEIKKIGLLLHTDESDKEWKGISIGMDFGSIIKQARKFYRRIESFEEIKRLKDWEAIGNFHLAFTRDNLVFFNSNNVESYFNHFHKEENIKNKARQIPTNDLNIFLEELSGNKIIEYNHDKKEEVQRVILNKGYSTINVCPALYLRYFINRKEVIRLDESYELEQVIREQINLALNIVKQKTDIIEACI